jgi:Family of unknown function (DUF5694)
MSTSTEAKIAARVMLLGTFHFHDAGLDWYRSQYDIGVLSDQRQREIHDVVTRLAAFAPTKIAVERRPDCQAELDRQYHDYLHNLFSLPGSEIYQLGFRLAQRLGHPRIYGIDAWGRYYDPPLELESYGQGRTTKELNQFLEDQFHFDPNDTIRQYAQRHGQEHYITAWQQTLAATAQADDLGKTTHSIRENLVRCNREQVLLENHGFYLTGWFKIGVDHEYPGVDWVTAWYSRNLRIFANLQRITEDVGERILVIYGLGHIPLLRHCVLASPDYALVEVHDYLV